MQIGPWWVPPYTLRIALGILSGLCWLGLTSIKDRLLPSLSTAQEPTRKVLIKNLAKLNSFISAPPSPRWTSWMTLTFVWIISTAALTMGRLGYVVGNWPYFSQSPSSMIQLRRVGGLHGGSAWMGGILAAGLWARTQRRFASDTVAHLAPLALLTAAGAWWGCADVGCAWGQEAWQGLTKVQRLIIVEAPDLYHTMAPRYAVQNLGLIWALAMALCAMLIPQCGALAVAAYLLGEAALTQLRGDPVPMLGSYRVDLLLSLSLALIVWIMQWYRWYTLKKLPTQNISFGYNK